MIERIVLACSNLGDVVLDPFAGSGTTGAAAMAHGRSSVMIEREPTYWPIIEKRLALKEAEKPATVIHGDVLTEMRKMAEGSVDIIVTSPPYNLGESSGGGFKGSDKTGKWTSAKLRDGYDGHDDAMPYEDYVAWQKAFLRECWRLIPDDGAIFYQHKNRVQNGVLRTPHDLNPDLLLRQIIIWDRGSGMNFSKAFATPSHEVIYVFAKPKFRFRKRHGLKDVLKILPDRGNPHPAPFPVEFTYAPSAEHYWMHGHSSETDFIYVTTNSLTHEQLAAMSDEVGPERTLLICCKAFQGGNADAFGNLTIRKIPGAILDRCEWGKDDYSLKIEALPLIEDEPEDDVDEAPRRKSAGNPNQPGLFGVGEEVEP
ncbi:site-specific DNA-methyltransferase [uncultured Brevundimonas sp.]|uniref:site-specific DNA-methyltransferase n=1 Tax=uncultured Brevundimonas sp. TaxID=213418 RepID=UPI00259348D3|nr:site-specific DNA-methyltransferase [uncultured Brevundimonas sp.]